MKIPRIVKSPKRLFRIFVILFLLVILSLLSICIYDCILDDSGVARKLHLDMWDWFALLVAAILLLFTVLTWWSQDQTRENTTRLSTVDYRDMLVSCYYNIVRNTINLYSLSECLKDRYTGYYPSEEYLQKLKLYLFDANQISSQDIPKYYYGHFQRIAELCRYFNFHIDATQKHLSSRVIGGDIKKRDMDALVSMNWLVASEIMKTINFICPNEEYGNRDLVREQFIKVTGHFCPDIASFQDIDHLPYINKHNVKFLTILFEDRQEDYDATLKALNAAIKWHLGNRPDGYPRIGLIPIR